MFAPIIVLVCLGGALTATVNQKPYYDIDIIEYHFDEFIRVYNKTYSSVEEREMRMTVFKENVIRLNELNQKHEFTIHGINQFTDLTAEEFLDNHSGCYQDRSSARSLFGSPCSVINLSQLAQAPESFDWRSRNAVTPAKNQRTCGSCWAHSLTGNVESQYLIKHQVALDLSEQQLVDCNQYSDCKAGSTLEYGMSTLIGEGGQMSEASYPYEDRQSTCRFNPSQIQVRVSGCLEAHTQDEENLKNILYNYGPLSFGVDAHSFNTYTGSVLQECASGPRNHAVLLVGYGTENGLPYWLVKNSYGSNWGEGGYIKIRRGVNACNMMDIFVAATIE